MEEYNANSELEKVLLKYGFQETTSDINRKKGKKEFKLSKLSRKEVYFDYINICIINSSHIFDSKISLTEDDLKMLLMYFKLNPNDRKEVFINDAFSFEKAFERLESLKNECKNLAKFNCQQRRRQKLEKIINFYDTIEL